MLHTQHTPGAEGFSSVKRPAYALLDAPCAQCPSRSIQQQHTFGGGKTINTSSRRFEGSRTRVLFSFFFSSYSYPFILLFSPSFKNERWNRILGTLTPCYEQFARPQTCDGTTMANSGSRTSQQWAPNIKPDCKEN